MALQIISWWRDKIEFKGINLENDSWFRGDTANWTIADLRNISKFSMPLCSNKFKVSLFIQKMNETGLEAISIKDLLGNEMN